jgi:N-acetylglucosaminyl-diphospho-decaprenol L-rhamnosyltransferase
MNARYTIVIPVLNQRVYTQMCVESLLAEGVAPQRILIIDNASTDDTPQWLASLQGVRHLRNRVNLGCGGAWTQGALLALESEWTVLLNNDVLSGPRAIESLLDSAEAGGFQVASPALLEGENDYDFARFAPGYVGASTRLVPRRVFRRAPQRV